MNDSNAQIAAEVEATCRRYLAAYPAALWRYLTDDSDIDYDALGFWFFPMMFIIGSSESSSVTIVDRDLFDSQVRAVYDQYYVDGWGGGLRLDAAKVSRYCADRDPGHPFPHRRQRLQPLGFLLLDEASRRWLEAVRGHRHGATATGRERMGPLAARRLGRIWQSITLSRACGPPNLFRHAREGGHPVCLLVIIEFAFSRLDSRFRGNDEEEQTIR
jgi:hypothetical protein